MPGAYFIRTNVIILLKFDMLTQSAERNGGQCRTVDTVQNVLVVGNE